MEKAGDFIGRAVRRMERPEATLAWLVGAWPGIAGKMLAAHARPIRCENGRLELSVDAKSWQQQLEPMAQEIRDRINHAWGGPLIREVKFLLAKPGPVNLPRELRNDYTPFIRRRRS